MSLGKLHLAIIDTTPRKACNNNTKVPMVCPECVIETKNSKKFDSPKSLFHHVVTVHKDWTNRQYTKKQFIKMLDGLSKTLDLGIILGVIER